MVKHLKLGVGQFNGPAPGPHFPPPGMNHQFIHPDDIIIIHHRPLAAPQNCFDPGNENPGRKRFGHVIVGAQFQAGHHIGFPALGGQHENRNAAGAIIAFQPPRHLQPVNTGQHQVEKDQVGPLAVGFFEGFFAAGRRIHPEPLPGEVDRQQLEDIFLIVDSQNRFLCHRRLLQRFPCRTISPSIM